MTGEEYLDIEDYEEEDDSWMDEEEDFYFDREEF